MKRIDATFARLRAAGRTAVIPYVTSGDPSKDATVPIMHALVAAGADVIELGVPFSDPMADGPVIQRASERALAKGTGLADVLAMVAAFRATDEEALKAFHECCRIEGIIPALESSHALAYATKLAPTMRKDQVLLVNLSGRGDKDLHIVAEASGLEFYCRASCREASIAYKKAGH